MHDMASRNIHASFTVTLITEEQLLAMTAYILSEMWHTAEYREIFGNKYETIRKYCSDKDQEYFYTPTLMTSMKLITFQLNPKSYIWSQLKKNKHHMNLSYFKYI